MTDKRFTINNNMDFNDKIETYELNCLVDNENKTFYFIADSIENVQLFIKRLNELNEENIDLHIQNDFLKDENQHMRDLVNENKQLKAQLYCDDKEGVCNICKHHYLVKDDEVELAYYTSRCKKGHYECARVSLKHCEDFEKE